MQGCWAISRATLLCHLDNSCQLFYCVLFSCQGHGWERWGMQGPLWEMSLSTYPVSLFYPKQKAFTLRKAHLGCGRGDTPDSSHVSLLSPGWGHVMFMPCHDPFIAVLLILATVPHTSFRKWSPLNTTLHLVLYPDTWGRCNDNFLLRGAKS